MKQISLTVKGIEDYSASQYKITFTGVRCDGSLYLNKAEVGIPPQLGDFVVLHPLLRSHLIEPPDSQESEIPDGVVGL